MKKCITSNDFINFSEKHSNMLIFEFRTAAQEPESNELKIDKLSQVIMRFIHAIHSLKGLPPVPLQKVIQPIISTLNSDCDPKMKEKCLALMTQILSEHIPDISALQTTFLRQCQVLEHLKTYLEGEAAENLNPEIIIRFIQRICYRNQVTFDVS